MPWETAWGLGAIVLVLALLLAVHMSRRRRRANDKVTEAATREEYDRPQSYDEDKFKQRLRE